jgi:lipopolysaccharide/colanic/teichoic acid biosynthesis glycosyltransferase
MHSSDTNLAASRIDTSEEFPVGIAMSVASHSEKMLILPVKADPRVRQHSAMKVEPANRNLSRLHQAAERSLDIAGSLALIVLLLPVMLLLTVAVALACDGSPVFAHTRIGKGGRKFECYKFRSMHLGAEQRLTRLLAESPALRREWERDHKLGNDPRVTPFGGILRVTSLDELPQLFNVLIGDMSLVGPRPVVAAELRRYGRFQSTYLNMKPGLTGLWQISGRNEASYRRRVATDRLYARRKSIVLDCKILLATVPAVLTRRGAC